MATIGKDHVRAGSIVEPTAGAMMILARREPADLAAIADLAEAGRLIPRLGGIFSLEKAAEAQRATQEGRASGKIVLEVP